MEKRAVITDETPPATGPVRSAKANEPLTKTAADVLEEHPTVRAADAVEAAILSRKAKTPGH